MDFTDDDALIAAAAAAPPGTVKRIVESDDARLKRADHENDLEYLQALLKKLGYTDYGDATRCINNGCVVRPSARATPCNCRALCASCVVMYLDTPLAQRCPVCMQRGVVFLQW